jgi:metal-responsive CopG/Arc/MetJ family transcriptional regulator
LTEDQGTLSREILKAVDEQAGSTGNRSEFIEKALRSYLDLMFRLRRDARDLDIINRTADRLNDEADDVLSYQVIP